MAWYDEIANTTKGNVQGLVNALSHPIDTAKAQLEKGAPYRQALASALQGDMLGVNQALSKSELTPADFGMMLSTIKGVGKAPFESALNLAQQRATLPVNKGGLGLPKNNTAMDRAKAMGFDDKTYYHGTNADIKAFNPEMSSQGGITWIADTPKYANDFTMNQSIGAGNIIPLKANMGKTAGWKEYDQLGLDELSGRGYNSTWLPESNAESVGFVMNPNQLRSTNAAFDPFNRNSSDILAGVGVGFPILSKKDNKDKNTK